MAATPIAHDQEIKNESTDGEGPLANGLIQGRTSKMHMAAR